MTKIDIAAFNKPPGHLSGTGQIARNGHRVDCVSNNVTGLLLYIFSHFTVTVSMAHMTAFGAVIK